MLRDFRLRVGFGLASLFVVLGAFANCSNEEPYLPAVSQGAGAGGSGDAAASDGGQADNGSPSPQGSGGSVSAPDSGSDATADTSDSAPADSTTDAPTDGPVEGGSDAEAGTTPLTCGAGPHVLYAGLVIDAMAPTTAVAGATVDFLGCKASSAADGKFAAMIAQNQPIHITYSGEGFLTTMTGEFIPTQDNSTAKLPLLSTVAKTLWATKWTTGEAAILVSTDSSKGQGSCAAADGITFSVTDAAGNAIGATITYFDTSPLPQLDNTLTATSATGRALVTGLPSTGMVQIKAAKSTCTISNAITSPSSTLTGKVPVAADTLTMTTLYVQP